jgi:acyl carrier protein
VPGELFIGGDGVARGYFHDPGLTAQRFERHPFSGDPSARVFRTGDLARYRSDGCVVFLGRTDDQVKVQGHRIELGEIESVLGRHPGVRQAVAVARDGPDGPVVLAYYVPAPGSAPTDLELKRHLGRHLPAAMIPSMFVALPTLPVTPNGKVNRRGLPAPEAAPPRPVADRATPRSSVEEALGQIWKDILGVEAVGLHDNFFELGGDSLALIRVASRIQSVLQVKLPLRAILDGPTVAQLAPLVEQRSSVTHPKAESPGPAEPAPIRGARLGRDADGNAAWFLPDPDRPGKYLQIGAGS